MKRSENVGLIVMGGAAFAATFAAGMTYFAWQKPGHAGQPQQAAAQTCTARPDGTQSCQPSQRGFAYYLFPSWGSHAASAQTGRAASAALTNNARASTPAVSPSGTTRGGFGGTAQSGSFRVSAGG